MFGICPYIFERSTPTWPAHRFSLRVAAPWLFLFRQSHVEASAQELFVVDRIVVEASFLSSDLPSGWESAVASDVTFVVAPTTVVIFVCKKSSK